MFHRSSPLAVVFAVLGTMLSLVPLVWGQGDFAFRGGLETLTFTGGNSALLTLKVAGFNAEVRVQESTRIRSASGQVLTLLELAVGSSLEVTADWINGAFTATVLTVPEYEQVGAVGIIETLLPGRLVISGTEFLLDENAAPLVEQLTAGQLAAVLGSVSWNGSLLATQIVSQEQFWIFGQISRKSDIEKTITVASRVVHISDTTKLLGTNKSVLTFNDLLVVATVSISGKSSAGKLTAEEVRVVETNNRVEIRGEAIAYGNGSITIKSMDTPFVIYTDAKTEVVGTITPGTMVSISAILQPDGKLLALRIVSKAGTGDGKSGETGFTGIVEKVDSVSATLVVQGMTVCLAPGAVLRSGEKDILIADLKVGDKVKITGTKQTNGTFLATRIDVMTAQPSPSTSVVFEGVIESITVNGSGARIQVQGKAVIVSENTAIQSADRNIKVAALKVGDKVKVSGTKQADGSYLAQQIVVISTSPAPADTAFEGAIEQKAENGKSLVVSRITVFINEKTVIQSGSKVITFADLKVGDKVKIKGQKQADGSYIASLVYVITPTPSK